MVITNVLLLASVWLLLKFTCIKCIFRSLCFWCILIRIKRAIKRFYAFDNNRQCRLYVFGSSSVRLLTLSFMWRDISLLSGGISMKPATNIYHTSGNYWKRFSVAGNYVMGHSRWTSGPGAAAAWWLIVLWLMQYLSKELWVVDICTSWSRRLHNIWIVDCQVYSKVN